MIVAYNTGDTFCEILAIEASRGAVAQTGASKHLPQATCETNGYLRKVSCEFLLATLGKKFLISGIFSVSPSIRGLNLLTAIRHRVSSLLRMFSCQFTQHFE